MPTRLAVTLAASAVALAGCGASGSQMAAVRSPPNTLGVSVMITGSRVTASPARFGAGPVLLTVTNQARTAESLGIVRGHGTVATTAPLNPQGSTQLSVILRRGRYTLTAGGPRSSTRPGGRAIQPTTLLVGRERPSSGSSLLSP